MPHRQHFTPANDTPARAAQSLLSRLALCVALLLVAIPLAYGAAFNGFIALAIGIMMAGCFAACSTLMWPAIAAARADMHRLAAENGRAHRKQEMAATAARENARLLATMSHEIRTPLNGVTGMLGLLLETGLTAEQKNYASIAHASGRTLLSILDELLDRSKSEALDPEKDGHVDLAAVVENVTELLAPRAHAKNIEISSYVAADVPHAVQMKDLHIRQVLFNLAGNAIKFTQQGGVEISVNSAGPQHIEIAICDTGIGMSDDELARVFEEFQQANEDTARRFGGTGLGLSISRHLVEGMGGTLDVASAPLKGTCFTVRLPAKPVGDAAPQPDRLLTGRHYALALSPGYSARHMRQALQDLGATTEDWGASAQGISQAYRKRSPGLAIVCDHLTAPQLLSLTRKDKTQRKIANAVPHVWIMINAEDRRNLRHLLDRPNTGYLVRPVRRSTLIAQLTSQDAQNLQHATGDLRQLVQPGNGDARYRLLLVDDTPVNALLAKAMLTKAGHELVTATSGQAALDLLAEDRNFDVVLLDVEMAGLDGHATARALRAREAAEGQTPLPVLALTAHARAEDVSACLRSGMDGHLAKPFDRQDLEEALHSLARPRAA